MKPLQQLPKWLKLIIRIILLPAAMLLHLIPHLVGYVLGLKNWVIYGGEFITYEKNESTIIADIYQKLKDMENETI